MNKQILKKLDEMINLVQKNEGMHNDNYLDVQVKSGNIFDLTNRLEFMDFHNNHNVNDIVGYSEDVFNDDALVDNIIKYADDAQEIDILMGAAADWPNEYVKHFKILLHNEKSLFSAMDKMQDRYPNSGLYL